MTNSRKIGYVHDYMDIGGRMNQETESRKYCMPVIAGLLVVLALVRDVLQ